MGIVTDLIYIVVAALVGGSIAHAFRQPLLLGYIVAGIVVGPYTGGPTVVEVRDIELLAEVGVGLLLFTVGLEFSFKELARFKKLTLLVTPFQVALCAVAGVVILTGAGFSFSVAVWIGGATALSSTMVISKVVSGRRDIPEEATRSMLGVLIAQDVLVVPLMIILPVLVGGAFSALNLLVAAAKAGGFLLILYALGTRLFPILLRKLARSGSQELFFLATVAIALGTGAVAHYFGLSFALGAFVAGMLLSDTDFSHQALADVSGLRDLFGMVFFVSVGMLLDPKVLLQSWGSLLFVTGALVLVKLVVLWGLLRISTPAQRSMPLVACGLAQIGEFAFVIGNEGVAQGVISPFDRSFVIGCAVLSMIVTPQLLTLGMVLARKLAGMNGIPLEPEPAAVTGKGGVLIIGGGSVAEMAARSLGKLGEMATVIERDIDRLYALRLAGINSVFGDARNIDKIAHSELSKTSVALITTTDDNFNQGLITTIRSVRNDIPMVVRVDDVEKNATAKVPENVTFIQPQAEAALEMVRESLLYLGRSPLEASSAVGELRPILYSSMCSDVESASALLDRQRATRQLELRWYDITRQSRLFGLKLRDTNIREDFSLTIVAVIRGGQVIQAPDPDLAFEDGDSVALLGNSAHIADFVTK